VEIAYLKSQDVLPTEISVFFAKHSAITTGKNAHTHDFMEFFLIAKGKVIHEVNKKQIELNTGDFVLIRPFDVHRFIFPKNKNDNFELLNLAFSTSIFEQAKVFLDDKEKLSSLYHLQYPPIIRFSENEMLEFTQDVQGCAQHEIEDKDAARIKYRKLILNLFVNFFLITKRQEKNNIPGWLKMVHSQMMILKNFQVGIQRMRELAFCSPEHLNREFIKYYEIRPTAFINGLRVEYTAMKLSNTDESITSIAYDVGFSNISHFYHLFHKRFKCSPAQYRKKRHRNVLAV
jgi:AraC-like DNA-binding protein